jgi:hypothetical protein
MVNLKVPLREGGVGENESAKCLFSQIRNKWEEILDAI